MKRLSEAQIIVKMREALDVLKAQYQKEAGGWILIDFMDAAQNKSSWVNKVVEAERITEYEKERNK